MITPKTTPKKSSSHLPLADSVAVVTGAGGGIGRAIAVSLARQGATLCAVGRSSDSLGKTVAEAQVHSRTVAFQVDFAVDTTIHRLAEQLDSDFGRLDILVHCAGVIYNSPMHSAPIEDLDSQYALGVRAPYLLTKLLLSLLKKSRGQVVFINSTLGLVAKRPDFGQFAATQHAMKAIADSLREEVNADGIRILTVYTGRTATSRQERLYKSRGKAYRPELLMQPDDIAAMVVSAVCLPRTTEVTDIILRPMLKSY